MDTDLLQTSDSNNTCRVVQSRVLCAVCGAPAIGNEILLFNFHTSLFVYFAYIGRNFDALTCLSCKGIYI